MHPGLLVFMKLQARAAMRQMLWGIKTWSGAVLFGLGAFSFLLWLVFTLLPNLSAERTRPEVVQAVAPVVLLVVCLFTIMASVAGQTKVFSPSEVDFLFTAPFSRRELVTYKILKGMVAAVPAAVICTLLCARHVGSWMAGLIGFMLGLVFVQLVSMAFLLMGRALVERAHTETRRWGVLVLLVLLLASLALPVLDVVRGHPGASVQQLRYSWIGYCLVGIFQVFGKTISARALFPELAVWGLLGLGIDMALTLLIVRLDVSYVEMARRFDLTSGRSHPFGLTDIQLGQTGHPGRGRCHLYRFPWLSGTGPIAWRQVTSAMRNSRGIIWLLLLMAATAGPIVVAAALQGRRIGSVTAGIVWLVVFVPVLFRFDFRSDLEHFEWLKLLPLNPTALALGEIAPAALLTTMVQVLLLAGLCWFLQGSKMPVILAMVFALPLNGLMFSVENLLFLLFPERGNSVRPGSFRFVGRQLAFFLAKTILLMPCLVFAVLIAGLAFSLSGDSWPVFFLVGWCTLALETAALIPCVGWVFERFDLSTDL